ncbi:hypothetical protein B9Z19DRAFT_1195564 [Tuber borchii]|uniref:Uncharacterized protein n=1 Tax=Tuber borchii TaxID=42251 RepID=A0A2T6ZIM0_TUBBO|nr:hypothetical protein B9Z19DRAFT_1195564 [Tuber borchii]
MPAVLQFLIRNLLPQFNNREKMENKGGDASDERNLAVMGLIGALLALSLAITSYRRWRINHPAPSLLPSPFYHDPLQQAPKTLLPNGSTTIPPPDLARVNHVSIVNYYSNAPFVGANVGTVTLSYQNNGISKGDMRVA